MASSESASFQDHFQDAPTIRRGADLQVSPDQHWGLTIIGTESRVKLLTPVERPRHADFRIPVITMKFRPSGRFISAGEYRGSGLGFL